MTIRNEFAVHMLNETGQDKARVIEGHRGPGGREMAIVRIKLEEACFFAKKAMATQLENQGVAP